MMTAPVPFVAEPGVAVLSGPAAFVIASLLRSRWPAEMVDGLAPGMRATVLAGREAVLRAADAYRVSVSGSAEAPAVEVGAHSEETNWITSAEAGRMMGVSERRVRQLLADGRLAGRLVAGRWQVDRGAALGVAAGRAA